VHAKMRENIVTVNNYVFGSLLTYLPMYSHSAAQIARPPLLYKLLHHSQRDH